MSNRIAPYWKDLDTWVATSSARAVAESQRLAASPRSNTKWHAVTRS
ncbi:hypothetical protein [Gemmatimonas sp.]|nr:hypothetical protein [Gemmatimonas sp.]